MKPIKLRNPKAEQAYYRILARWQDACENQDKYSTEALAFIWNQLEASWKAIGYEIVDPDLKKVN